MAAWAATPARAPATISLTSLCISSESRLVCLWPLPIWLPGPKPAIAFRPFGNEGIVTRAGETNNATLRFFIANLRTLFPALAPGKLLRPSGVGGTAFEHAAGNEDAGAARSRSSATARPWMPPTMVGGTGRWPPFRWWVHYRCPLRRRREWDVNFLCWTMAAKEPAGSRVAFLDGLEIQRNAGSGLPFADAVPRRGPQAAKRFRAIAALGLNGSRMGPTRPCPGHAANRDCFRGHAAESEVTGPGHVMGHRVAHVHGSGA